jgi:hypothetical protein
MKDVPGGRNEGSGMKHPREVFVVDRFAPLQVKLLGLLADLSEDDWARPTAAPGWSVKDVAAHLLGGDIGILSRRRDGFRPSSTTVGAHSELVDLVNRLNQEWAISRFLLMFRFLFA